MKKRNWRKITLKKLWDYLVVINVKYLIWHFCAYFPLFQDLMLWKIRPMLWRLIGVKVGKNVLIGYGVYLDVGGCDRIYIGDNVIISAQCLLLAHKRNIKLYQHGIELQNELPFKELETHIEDNVSLGMRSIVLPGVTIGKNSIIGTSSLVSKNVPENVIGIGNPITFKPIP